MARTLPLFAGAFWLLVSFTAALARTGPCATGQSARRGLFRLLLLQSSTPVRYVEAPLVSADVNEHRRPVVSADAHQRFTKPPINCRRRLAFPFRKTQRPTR